MNMRKIGSLLVVLAVFGLMLTAVTAVAVADEADDDPVPVLISAEDDAEVTAEADEIAEEEEITIEDLGVEEPTLLPNSRFYFLKKWKRGFQRAFTFNPVKKAELELKITDEELAEVIVLSEEEEGSEEEKEKGINRAITNYHVSQDRLKARLEALKETSENPNVDRLLDKLADRTVKHDQVFTRLQEKFANKEVLKAKIIEAKKKIEDGVVAAANKNGAENFAKRLEKSLVEGKGGDLKHFRSMEILDRVYDKAGADFKERLDGIRDNISDQLKEDLNAFAERRGDKAETIINRVIEKFPGDRAKWLRIRQNASTTNSTSTNTDTNSLRPAICTMEYNPVCGVNEKTYSNPCGARVSGVAIKYKGKCQNDAPINNVCTDEYMPVCGVDGKTYSNACGAKVSGVAIKYRDKCKDETNGSDVATSTTNTGNSLNINSVTQ